MGMDLIAGIVIVVLWGTMAYCRLVLDTMNPGDFMIASMVAQAYFGLYYMHKN